MMSGAVLGVVLTNSLKLSDTGAALRAGARALHDLLRLGHALLDEFLDLTFGDSFTKTNQHLAEPHFFFR